MKHEAVNQFWRDWKANTAGAFSGGIFLAFLLTGSSRLFSSSFKSVLGHPVLPLYMGIAGGIALSQCADRFNRLERIEEKIARGKSSDNELKERKEHLV